MVLLQDFIFIFNPMYLYQVHPIIHPIFSIFFLLHFFFFFVFSYSSFFSLTSFTPVFYFFNSSLFHHPLSHFVFHCFLHICSSSHRITHFFDFFLIHPFFSLSHNNTCLLTFSNPSFLSPSFYPSHLSFTFSIPFFCLLIPYKYLSFTFSIPSFFLTHPFHLS